MTIKRMLRISVLLLAAILLFSLVGCSAAREARPSSRANKIVATAGNLEIAYENLYYVTMTRIAELKRVHGSGVLEDPAQREALKAFVAEHLLTRSEALISIGQDYGFDVSKGDIADSVQADMDNILSNAFGNDREAYIESLNAEYLTDRYVRTYLAVEEYLPAALINEMLQSGDIDDSDEAARTLINGENFIRTVHVFISKTDGLYTVDEDRAHAKEIQAAIASKTTDDARYDAMRKAIGGKYNSDKNDVTGNGYYFARGEMESAYEEAAFALAEYGVSDVIETVDGFYIIMRMPKSAEYIQENFQSLKEKSYYVTLNAKVEERLSAMTLEMTDYGNSLDLMDLPSIDADGGEAPFIISIAVVCVMGAGVIGVLIYCVAKKRRTNQKRVKK